MILDSILIGGVAVWIGLCIYGIAYDHGKASFRVSLQEEFVRGKAEGYYECAVQQKDFAQQERRERLAKMQTGPIRRIK